MELSQNRAKWADDRASRYLTKALKYYFYEKPTFIIMICFLLYAGADRNFGDPKIF